MKPRYLRAERLILLGVARKQRGYRRRNLITRSRDHTRDRWSGRSIGGSERRTDTAHLG
jgi:hypothetical protein